MLAYHNNKNRYIELMLHKRNNCCYEIVLRAETSQTTFIFSKSTIKTLEKGVKCSKLTTKTSRRRFSSVSIFDFAHQYIL